MVSFHQTMAAVFAAAFLPSIGAASGDSLQSGWEPSASLGFTLQGQKINGRSRTGFLDISGTESPLTQIFSIGFELAAPPLSDDYGRPRPFIAFEFRQPINGEHLVYRNLDIQADPGATSLDPSTLDQEFSRIDATFGTLWSARLGMTFTIPISEYEVYVKPSLGWVGESVEIDGVASKRLEVTTVVGTGQNQMRVTTVPTDIRLSASESRFIHGAGVRLAIEVKTGRIGPIGLAPWVAVESNWRLGNRLIETGATSGSESALFEYELKRFVVQGGMGIRIYWAGD